MASLSNVQRELGNLLATTNSLLQDMRRRAEETDRLDTRSRDDDMVADVIDETFSHVEIVATAFREAMRSTKRGDYRDAASRLHFVDSSEPELSDLGRVGSRLLSKVRKIVTGAEKVGRELMVLHREG